MIIDRVTVKRFRAIKEKTIDFSPGLNIIKGSDNAEKIVSVKDDTAINRFREKIKVGDLKIDDQIVVIGEPNDLGQIEAKLIRVIPLGQFSAPMPMMRLR